jgi:hypothetical protein
MIKYRQLCFWIAVVVATASVGFAQTTPGQPAVVPADASPVSKAAEPATTTPKVATKPPKPAPAVRLTTTSKKASATQKNDPTVDSTEPARRIAIIELSPDMQKSEVIRQVVEILEKQGVAKQAAADATATKDAAGISARIAARTDTKTEDVVSLVRSLQEHGVKRMSFAMPTDNRNVVTVLAPADTPWPVIDNLRIMVTAKKQFTVVVQIATPVQPTTPTRIRSYNSGEPRWYGYSSTKRAGGAFNKPVSDKPADVATAAEPGQPSSPNKTVTASVQPPQETRVFRLQYADASVIAQGISQLFDKNFGIAPDVRTNAVIVRGDSSQIEEMEVLVEMLDRQQPKRLTEPAVRVRDPQLNGQQPDGDGKRLSVLYLDVPSTVASQARIQIQNLHRQTRKTADSLRSSETKSNEASEYDEKRKEELREVVRKTFLARQELQRAELAEFAARLKRIQQSIEMRDKIADKIIDRRVDELLDPNLKWDHSATAASQQRVTQTSTTAEQLSRPQQPTAIGSPTAMGTRPSGGTVILRSADEFRELLVSHARRVVDLKAGIEQRKGLKKGADDESNADHDVAIRRLEGVLSEVEGNRKFALKEYQTQIQLLESEVETVHLVVETAKQALDRTQTLVKAKAAPSHELDKRNRELAAAMQRFDRARILLNLYQEAGEGN